MNAQLEEVTFTARDGRVGKVSPNDFFLVLNALSVFLLLISQLDTVYIRGSKIRFLVLPDMLKNAPMFKKQAALALRGKTAAARSGLLLLFEKMNPIPFLLFQLLTP